MVNARLNLKSALTNSWGHAPRLWEVPLSRLALSRRVKRGPPGKNYVAGLVVRASSTRRQSPECPWTHQVQHPTSCSEAQPPGTFPCTRSCNHRDHNILCMYSRGMPRGLLGRIGRMVFHSLSVRAYRMSESSFWELESRNHANDQQDIGDPGLT
jgi:hypothetical protein